MGSYRFPSDSPLERTQIVINLTEHLQQFSLKILISLVDSRMNVIVNLLPNVITDHSRVVSVLAPVPLIATRLIR